jgi:hypothetical protein
MYATSGGTHECSSEFRPRSPTADANACSLAKTIGNSCAASRSRTTSTTTTDYHSFQCLVIFFENIQRIALILR